MKLIKLLSILIILPIFSIAQSYVVPQSFKHLNKIEVNKDWKIFVFTPKNTDTNVYEIRKQLENTNFRNSIPICIVSIDGDNDSNILLGINEGASADPSFDFFKLINGEYIFLFTIEGQQLFIPGNGNLYISGEANNMFHKKRKFKYINDNIVEVKQPFYYVGKTTVTLKPIKLYSDKNCTYVLATLPAKAKIEIIAAQSTDEYNNYFLIKSSFGLLGWWKLDNDYSEKIEDFYFHGD